MKCFETVLFCFVLFLRHCVPTADADGVKWFEPLLPRELFVRGEITSIGGLAKASGVTVEDAESFAEKYPYVVYTALKCKYADFVADALRLFGETIAFCAENEGGDVNAGCVRLALKRFDGLKPRFVKMIYNLFFYSDKTPALRTSDPGLLKILLSLNSLMYHYSANSAGDAAAGESTEKTIRSARALRKSIVQTTGLVEQFGCKHCRVENHYERVIRIREQLKERGLSNVDAVVARLLGEQLETYRPLIDIETIGDYGGAVYNDYMYDPKCLVFSDLLDYGMSTIGKALIKVSKDYYVPLRDLYAATAEDEHCGIERVHKLQGYLFNAIADIFYVQIHNMIDEQKEEISPQVDVDVKTLIKLLSTFNKFVSKIVPNNCSTEHCQIIILNKKMSESILNLQRLNPNDSQFVYNLNNCLILRNDRKIVKWENEELKKFEDSEFLSLLIDNIEKQPQFKSFGQVAKLLSYEAYANNNYDVRGVKYFEYGSDRSNRNDDGGIGSTRDFLYVLILFRISLTATADRDGSSSVPAVASALSAATDDTPSAAEVSTKSPNPATNTGSNSATDAEEDEDNFTSFNKKHEKPEAERIPEIFRDNPIGILIFHTLTYVIKVYHHYINIVFWKITLNPLLLRFWYATQSFGEMNAFDYAVLDQVTLKTIYTIDNYELVHYFSPVYSSEVYESIVQGGSQTIDVEKIRNDLKAKTSMYVKGYNELDKKFLDKFANVIVQDKFVPREDDKDFSIIWNGERLFGFEVMKDVPRSVIDVNDIVMLHLCLIKFFLAKIVMKISIYFTLITEPINAGDVQTVEDHSEQQILEFLLKLNSFSFIGPYVMSLMSLLVKSSDSENTINKNRNAFIQKCLQNDLTTLGLVKQVTDTHYTQIEDVLTDLKIDVSFFTNLLCTVSDNQNTDFISHSMNIEMSYYPTYL